MFGWISGFFDKQLYKHTLTLTSFVCFIWSSTRHQNFNIIIREHILKRSNHWKQHKIYYLVSSIVNLGLIWNKWINLKFRMTFYTKYSKFKDSIFIFCNFVRQRIRWLWHRVKWKFFDLAYKSYMVSTLPKTFTLLQKKSQWRQTNLWSYI